MTGGRIVKVDVGYIGAGVVKTTLGVTYVRSGGKIVVFLEKGTNNGDFDGAS